VTVPEKGAALTRYGKHGRRSNDMPTLFSAREKYIADRKNKPRIRSAREYRICRIGS
jgi:hypothetical protein